MSAQALVELKQVQVVFDGRTVLDLDDLRVERGSSLALLGGNGAGKSTLLRVMGLLRHPTQGRVLLEGVDAPSRGRALLRARRRIANVLQESLLCRTTVSKNVAQGLQFRGKPKQEIAQKVQHWMEVLRIDHLRDRAAETLSGGEAQRTSLARALALDPELLLLDEPFAALDAPTRAALLADFQQALSESRTAVVLATHDRNDALAIADRVAVLSQGRLLQLGETEEVFARPANEEVARFTGSETLLPGRTRNVEEGLVDVSTPMGLLRIADPSAEGSVFVCIRPEDVHLHVASDQPGQSARNRLEGRVTEIARREWYLLVTVDCGCPVKALITRSALEELAIEVGSRVGISFKATAVHLIPRSRELED